MKFLTTSMYTKGHGGYYRHRRMARALTKAGHEVVWISPDVPNDIGEQLLPLVDFYKWIPGPVGWILRLRANFRHYREHLHDVDAIFTTNEYDAFGCILDVKARALPHIFFTHGDTINCEKYLAENSLKFGRRIKSRLMLFYYPKLQRKILKRFSHVVVQADFLADTLKARHPDIMCEYTVLTSDCVFDWRAEDFNEDHVLLLKKLKEEKKFIIGIIAQVFYKAKGFDIFLEAMAQLYRISEIHAVIIGYGDEAEVIPQNIKRLGLQGTVTYLGQSPAAHNLMSLLDVIVSPTQFFDAFPTVILEALDANCCIIASDIEAHKAQLSDETLLFRNGDSRHLADRLEGLYYDKNRRQKNKKIVRMRRKRFQFDWDSRVVRILEAGAES